MRERVTSITVTYKDGSEETFDLAFGSVRIYDTYYGLPGNETERIIRLHGSIDDGRKDNASTT